MTGSSPHDPYLRTVPLPAFVLDCDGRVSAWNGAAAECFGWRAVEVLGENPPCVPSVERGRWREALEDALAGEETADVAFSLRTVEDRRIEATVSMGAIDGGAFVCVEDHTKNSALSQEIELFDRVLRHNIRNDLNLVTGYADELADAVDDEDALALVEKVRENATSVVDLAETARNLDAALGESKPLEVVDLDAIAEAAAVEFFELGQAELSTDIDPVRARAAPEIDLAVRQLVHNAFVHNDAEDPHVRVAVDDVVRDGRRWATLVVTDDGPGIPAAERAVLTQGSETPLEHGSGLGLWLVYWVVRQSNGELEYEAVDPRGSRITLRLLAEEAAPP